ncbi:hypothetical protein NF27_FN00020 [Candidatus Jidaibacter acanthamoeba]|uniref:Uncharacterized protein n=1 Tax=Candidatus Jidaibacter acanthamoebae TaxID=86105 RepID=A0A0C1QL57_9RICK|nr:hypothetical protein [Candidatus Jidaibacter acanthamoeba]KIE04853.1 hypothetical protein NF27_FN00020 [Candidatus Jidaibacter acanthamoeba]
MKRASEKSKDKVVSKKPRVYRQGRIDIDDTEISEKRLDVLARVLDTGYKDCVAVCLVQGQLLIASNTIHAGIKSGQEEAREEVKIIRNVMSYYASVAQGKPPKK